MLPGSGWIGDPLTRPRPQPRFCYTGYTRPRFCGFSPSPSRSGEPGSPSGSGNLPSLNEPLLADEPLFPATAPSFLLRTLKGDSNTTNDVDMVHKQVISNLVF